MQIQIPEALGSYFSRFLKNVIAEYFPQLKPIDKKRIFASLLRNTSTKSDDIDKLMAIVYASGPFFQKLMQLLGDKLEKGRLKTALSTVKSKLPSIDPYDLEEYLDELRRDGIQLEIVRSLGAASVGETFLAKQTLESGEVRLIAIKFMRPGIEKIARRENKFFSEQAALISDTMKISFRQISKQIFDELNLLTELRNLELGASVYNFNEPNATGFAANIVAVRPIKGFPQTKSRLAMEFGNGKAVRDTRGIAGDANMPLRLAKLELMVKGILLDTLPRKFVRKALFREPCGFFHGDLHEGNMIIWIHPDIEDILDKAKVTGESLTRKDVESLLGKKDKFGEPLIKLILIDFGNSHELSESDRLALFNLVISVSDISLSPDAFLLALQQLSHGKQRLDFEVLLEKLKPIFGDNAIKFSDKIGKSIDILQQNDIFVPGLFVAFYRSIDLIGNSYKQLREDATEQNLFLEKLKMEDALTEEIVWRILDKLPAISWACHINNIFQPVGILKDDDICTWPDILSPENVKAMKPRMPALALEFFGKVDMGENLADFL
jgi:predicted unusual protein kinase regulating ubiquinone biosynthesis (AarF/ABC1/UbiB family)